MWSAALFESESKRSLSNKKGSLVEAPDTYSGPHPNVLCGVRKFDFSPVLLQTINPRLEVFPITPVPQKVGHLEGLEMVKGEGDGLGDGFRGGKLGVGDHGASPINPQVGNAETAPLRPPWCGRWLARSSFLPCLSRDRICHREFVPRCPPVVPAS